MLELVLGRARQVRHVLDAWCVALLCLAAYEIPRVGVLLSVICGILGLLAALRLVADGKWRLGLYFGAAFFLWVVFLPLSRIGGPRQPPHSQQPTNAPPAAQRLALAVPVQATVSPAPQYRPPVPDPEVAPSSEDKPEIPDAAVKSLFRMGTPGPPPSPESEAAEIVKEWWSMRRVGNHKRAASLHSASSVHGGRTLNRDLLARALDEDWRKGVWLEADLAADLSVTRTADLLTVRNPMRFSLIPPKAQRRVRWQAMHVFHLSKGSEGLEITSHTESIVPALPSTAEVNGISAPDMLLVASTCIEADLLGDVRSSAETYAPRVTYFGTAMTREQVSRDKRAYFERWPERNEIFFGEMAVGREPKGRTSCTFSGNFSTESEERGEWQEGVVVHTFVFEKAGKGIQIVAQSGKVTHVTKGRTDERD